MTNQSLSSTFKCHIFLTKILAKMRLGQKDVARIFKHVYTSCSESTPTTIKHTCCTYVPIFISDMLHFRFSRVFLFIF